MSGFLNRVVDAAAALAGQQPYSNGQTYQPASSSQPPLNHPKPLPQPSAFVVLDGSGNGTAKLGPQRAREHWQPTSAAVSVSTNTNEAQCSLYMGTSIGAQTFLGQTFTGSTGDTCGFGGQDIQTGMLVFAVWKGGDPGATGTVIVNGTYTIGAPS